MLLYTCVMHTTACDLRYRDHSTVKGGIATLKSPGDQGVPRSPENVSPRCSRYNGITNSRRIYTLCISLSSSFLSLHILYVYQ